MLGSRTMCRTGRGARDIGSLRFLQELKHHLGCLLLGKFSLLAAIGTSVYFP